VHFHKWEGIPWGKGNAPMLSAAQRDPSRGKRRVGRGVHVLPRMHIASRTRFRAARRERRGEHGDAPTRFDRSGDALRGLFLALRQIDSPRVSSRSRRLARAATRSYSAAGPTGGISYSSSNIEQSAMSSPGSTAIFSATHAKSVLCMQQDTLQAPTPASCGPFA
jgi:hypothetical protein